MASDAAKVQKSSPLDPRISGPPGGTLRLTYTFLEASDHMGVSGMDYRVMIVSDYALPSGVERVMVEKRGQAPVLVVAESAAGNWRFLEAWDRIYDGNEPEARCLHAV